MILADEIAAKEENLKKRASKKELALYHILIGNPLPYPGDDKLMNIEQVCLSAFCSSAPNKIDLVEHSRRTKPIKGIHYTNNLVELAAFAIYDREFEADHLKSFCSTSSARDHFILNQLFPRICTSRPSTTKAIDTIALWLEDRSFPCDWKPVFLDALQNANELLDLHVIRQGYMYLLDHHPSYEQTRDLQYLSDQLQGSIKYIKSRSNRWFNAIAITITGIVFPVIAYFAISYWDVAEPVIWVITVGVGIGLVLLILLFGKQFDKVHILVQARETEEQTALRKAGLDEETIRNVTMKYMQNVADIRNINKATHANHLSTQQRESD